MKENEEEEEWTTLRAGEGRKKDGEEKNDDENENDDENYAKIASVSEAIDACLHSFESRAKMYAEMKLAHRKVLEGLRRDASISSSTTTTTSTTDEKHSSSSSSSFSVEYEKSLAVFASNMNALNAKLKRVLHFLEEDEEDKEEDEKRVVLLLLRSVQEQEKEKLRLTAIEMALKTHYEMKKWTWQQDGYVEEEEEEEEEEENASTKLKPSWATHIAGEKNDAYEGLGNCCEQAPEPTKVEFENAMKETTMGLEKCIQTINDARDELLEIKASFLSL